jgi:hypothetical protein
MRDHASDSLNRHNGGLRERFVKREFSDARNWPLQVDRMASTASLASLRQYTGESEIQCRMGEAQAAGRYEARFYPATRGKPLLYPLSYGGACARG